MRKRVLKAWGIGLAISAVTVYIVGAGHWVLELLNIPLAPPLFPVIDTLARVGNRLDLSDGTMDVLIPVCLIAFGSLFHGLIVLGLMSIRRRRKA